MDSTKIVKIVANDDYVPDYNFGYPCILHGVEKILDAKYGKNGYELIVYARSAFRKEIVYDYSCTIKYTDSNPKKILLAAIFRKIGIKSKDNRINEIINNIMEADLIAGLYPITFCGGFNTKEKSGFADVLKMVIGQNLLLTIGKMYGKPTVKTVCSIGPFKNKLDSKSAKMASERLWDKVYAREKMSASQLREVNLKKSNPIVSPDLANVMNYTVKESRNTIGISVSFQIINQWKGKNNYIESLVQLCEYILENTDRDIVLIPNEFTPGLKISDISVANQIYEKAVKDKKIDSGRISVLDISNLTSKELKNEIASCEVMIASRYHSCVAALSAGVPLLVVGWHWKYQELLELYGQEAWAIPTELCDSEILKKKFAELWLKKEKIRAELKIKKVEVYNCCMKHGKDMFEVKR